MKEFFKKITAIKYIPHYPTMGLRLVLEDGEIINIVPSTDATGNLAYFCNNIQEYSVESLEFTLEELMNSIYEHHRKIEV